MPRCYICDSIDNIVIDKKINREVCQECFDASVDAYSELLGPPSSTVATTLAKTENPSVEPNLEVLEGIKIY